MLYLYPKNLRDLVALMQMFSISITLITLITRSWENWLFVLLSWALTGGLMVMQRNDKKKRKYHGKRRK